jgi:hypothetical protein
MACTLGVNHTPDSSSLRKDNWHKARKVAVERERNDGLLTSC